MTGISSKADGISDLSEDTFLKTIFDKKEMHF